MTEAEWLVSTDPEKMLRFVCRYTTRRKERLFAAACCWRLDDLLSGSCRELLARIELATDEPLSVVAQEELINDAMAHADSLSYAMDTPMGSARWFVGNAIWATAEGDAERAVNELANAVTTAKLDPGTHDLCAPGPPTIGDPTEFAAQADLLRHIVGNPFRPVDFGQAWRTTQAFGIAAKIFADQDFAAMPILADALEDAGCDSADILDHCRGPLPHVLGCWAVDLVLGKR